MKSRVITISREFGSGGRTIGKKAAEKLGIPYYDAEIIQEMAKESGFAPDYVKEAGEYAPGSFLSAAFSNRMFGPTNEDILWEHQSKVIIELAEKSPFGDTVTDGMSAELKFCKNLNIRVRKITEKEIQKAIGGNTL